MVFRTSSEKKVRVFLAKDKFLSMSIENYRKYESRSLTLHRANGKRPGFFQPGYKMRKKKHLGFSI